MAWIHISKDPPEQTPVDFTYDPQLIAKPKTFPGHRWHPTEKHWSFPKTDGILEMITEIYTHVSTRNIGRIRSPLDNLDLKKRVGNKNNH
ncbi:MAG: hypothetical protein A2Y79_10920 [Deltaproteobacteria bacterium RBG_13_43_22]|nr:MAG: hypothetical protein A2Y79_10920 [Deltaproteobacteria bacterium RBG_13_43_22]